MYRDREILIDTATAMVAVDGMTELLGPAAAPALIGACVLWSVEHGAADVVRQSLTNALALVDEAEGVRRGMVS